MAQSPEHPFLRLHAVNIYVGDQDESLRFYVDLLGFTVAFDARLQNGERWLAVAPPDGGAVLALVAPKPGSKEYEQIGRHTHIIFVVENVITRYNEWRRRGVRFSHTPRLRRVHFDRKSPGSSSGSAGLPGEQPVWGGVFTRFRDVDGNSFVLAGFDEVSRELDEQRRKTAERQEAERRTAQEIEIAKQVQARLFPQKFPPLKTLEYAGVCIQARQVGGDYYDFLDLGGERVGLVIGDIAGKGIAAALLMANLQANLRSQCAIASGQPRRFLQCVNDAFFENTSEGAYATLFFAEYDDSERLLRFANCGHLCGLVLRRDDTLERLDSTATVLGLFKEWDCSVGECRISAGDTIALYTDGITESSNERGEEFGEHGLIEALRRNRSKAPRDSVASIVDEVQRFGTREQFDDVTLIVGRGI